jgi:hypothetical protein
VYHYRKFTKEKMNQASVIRDKILSYALRRKVSQDALDKHGDEVVNRRILVPLCFIDVAYGIWQEQFLNLPVKQEMKLLKKRVQRLFNYGMFSRKGVIYGALNEDEMCYLSDISDKLNDVIKGDLQILHYTLQEKTMDMPTEQRNVLCNMLVMETILLISQSSIFYDWKCKYPILDSAVSAMFRMAQVYRQQVLGNKDTDLTFGDKDENFVNSVRIINNKIYSVAL